ncbi:hypothetical protein GCM10022207_69840 [Streptomyces lannensis]|uniref:Uncharacterized protein n=1 Tax=Streptomyces lannensis TaxID=766498 RepID=A0ABP7KZV9_9ACTN
MRVLPPLWASDDPRRAHTRSPNGGDRQAYPAMLKRRETVRTLSRVPEVTKECGSDAEVGKPASRHPCRAGPAAVTSQFPPSVPFGRAGPDCRVRQGTWKGPAHATRRRGLRPAVNVSAGAARDESNASGSQSPGCRTDE